MKQTKIVLFLSLNFRKRQRPAFRMTCSVPSDSQPFRRGPLVWVLLYLFKSYQNCKTQCKFFHTLLLLKSTSAFKNFSPPTHKNQHWLTFSHIFSIIYVCTIFTSPPRFKGLVYMDYTVTVSFSPQRTMPSKLRSPGALLSESVPLT